MRQNQNVPYLHSLLKHTKKVSSDDWPPVYKKKLNLVTKNYDLHHYRGLGNILLKYKAKWSQVSRL